GKRQECSDRDEASNSSHGLSLAISFGLCRPSITFQTSDGEMWTTAPFDRVVIAEGRPLWKALRSYPTLSGTGNENRPRASPWLRLRPRVPRVLSSPGAARMRQDLKGPPHEQGPGA